MAEFDGATMHTPVEVTERALDVLREHSADCLVAVGGGSTTGLAKALALRTDVPQPTLPTTYAGSEVTPVLGETQNGRKTTVASPAILPETVVYDVEFTLGLPVGLSVTSAVNAMAHAVEALYAPQANPIDAMALDAIALSARALPVFVAEPSDTAARADLLRAAWLAGTCLGFVGMAASQAVPHAGGRVRLAARRDAHRDPAARDGLQRPGRSGRHEPHRRRTRRAGCSERDVRPDHLARGPHLAARAGHGGGGSAACRAAGGRHAVPQPPVS